MGTVGRTTKEMDAFKMELDKLTNKHVTCLQQHSPGFRDIDCSFHSSILK